VKSDYFHALGTLKLHPSSLDVDPICSRSGQFMCCCYVKSQRELQNWKLTTWTNTPTKSYGFFFLRCGTILDFLKCGEDIFVNAL